MNFAAAQRRFCDFVFAVDTRANPWDIDKYNALNLNL
jgi:hypothetical protein